MIREWASDVAEWLGKKCLARSRVWSRRSELMSDVAEWLATPVRWAEIRGRRGEGEGA